jgi:hypothetical protein
LKTHLLPQLRKGTRFDIQHVDSTTGVNIQLADFVSGAIFQRL